MTTSEDCLAGLLLANSGWNTFHMSSSEDCLAAWLHASYGCDRFQMSSSEDCLAGSLPGPARTGRNVAQMSSCTDCLAVPILASSDWNFFQMSSQALKTAWQGHFLQALVETIKQSENVKLTRLAGGLFRFCKMAALTPSIFCDPFQCMLSVRDWNSVDATPCSMDICWNICAREHCSLAHTCNAPATNQRLLQS